MLASIRLRQIVTDPDLKDLFEEMAAKSAEEGDDDLFREMREESGVDPSQVEEMLIASPQRDIMEAARSGMGGGMPSSGSLIVSPDATPTSPSDPGVLVLLQGSFDRGAILAAISRNNQGSGSGGNATPVAYQGATIYRLDSDDSDGDMFLAFLTNNRLAVGTEQWVKAALDAQAGRAPRLTGPIVEGFAALGTPLVKVHMLMPPMPVAATPPPATPVAGGMDISFLTKMLAFSMSVDKSGQGLVFSASQRYADDATAQASAKAMQAIITLMGMFSEDPTVKVVFSRLATVQQGSTVVTSATFTLQEIRQVMATPTPVVTLAAR
jgi:hypothetical protein